MRKKSRYRKNPDEIRPANYRHLTHGDDPNWHIRIMRAIQENDANERLLREKSNEEFRVLEERQKRRKNPEHSRSSQSVAVRHAISDFKSGQPLKLLSTRNFSEAYARAYNNASIRLREKKMRGHRKNPTRKKSRHRKNPGELPWLAREAEGKAKAEARRATIERAVETHDRFQASWALKNMIRALGMMPWENTVEDYERLYEAKIIMKARQRQAAQAKKRR
jgi:hypothetical protein